MPRKGHIPKREVMPDAKYNDRVVTKLINNVMLDGKKGLATKIVYEAFDIVQETKGEDAIEVFHQAMENIMPTLEVKARRIGGAEAADDADTDADAADVDADDDELGHDTSWTAAGDLVETNN